jgi:Flp pilus assembly protein TadG
MRRVRLDSITRWIGSWQALSARQCKGQVAIMMAGILMALMGLAGAGVDYGFIIIESSKLQNAVDAASLSGARALATSAASTQATRSAEGDTKARDFLISHGYSVGTIPSTETTEVTGTSPNTVTWYCKNTTSGTNTFKFCRNAAEGGAYYDRMRIDGTVVRPTSFWKVIGINSTTLNRTSTAVSSGGMVDVMLSLDLTGSMELSGTNDMGNLRVAVDAFIDQMQIHPTNPRGTRMGISRWAGVNCSWTRGTQANPTDPRVSDSDTWIDVDTGPSTTTGEYTTPCYDDATVLSWLSQDKDKLKRISSNASSTTVCPSAPAAPATPTTYSPGTMAGYACPLASWRYTVSFVPQVAGFGTPTTTRSGAERNDNSTSWTGYTGTKLSNAMKIVNGTTTGCYAWATTSTSPQNCPTNGRNDPTSSDGLARKVLVIMTDGFSQSGQPGLPNGYPSYTTTAGTTLSAPGSWDDEAIDLANRLKRGPDNDATTTADNVEIYVVGFFCVDYNDNEDTGNWCRSKAADYGSITATANTHPCPAGSMPISSRFSYALSSASPGVDEVLNNISSSTPGSCDHYFPIAKSEGAQLPQLFRVLAGSIARGRLQ